MDNVDCGGMAARIDVETGRLLTVGAVVLVILANTKTKK